MTLQKILLEVRHLTCDMHKIVNLGRRLDTPGHLSTVTTAPTRGGTLQGDQACLIGRAGK